MEWRVLQKQSRDLLRRLARANMPDSNGALGRNKEGYFHVAFQRELCWPLVYGVLNQDQTRDGYTDRGVRAMEYALAHQQEDGGFLLSQPNGTPGYATDVDVALGTAMFMAALGRGLMLLEQSAWFRESGMQGRIQKLRPGVWRALDWLDGRHETLRLYGADAVNRLWFAGAAFYLCGRWTGDGSAIQAGRQFAEFALERQTNDGVFPEAQGHDSSYQAVSLFRALTVYCHWGMADDPLRKALEDGIKRGVAWEMSRILSTGEVSTEGNTRVRPDGGESFLGNEKQVAFVDVVMSLYYSAALASDGQAQEAADRVLGFYG